MSSPGGEFLSWDSDGGACALSEPEHIGQGAALTSMEITRKRVDEQVFAVDDSC